MELNAKIITPEKVIYEGPVGSVESVNGKGPFSILPHHTNFISIIQEKIVIHHVHKSVEEFPIKKGIMFCKDSSIEAYVSDSEEQEEFN